MSKHGILKVCGKVIPTTAWKTNEQSIELSKYDQVSAESFFISIQQNCENQS